MNLLKFENDYKNLDVKEKSDGNASSSLDLATPTLKQILYLMFGSHLKIIKAFVWIVEK